MSGGWAKDHKEELMAAAAIAGIVATAGASAPASAGLLAGEAAGGLAGSGFAGLGGASEAAAGGLLGGDLIAQGSLPLMSGGFTDVAANPLAPSFMDKLGTGLDRFGKLSRAAQMAQGQQQPPPPVQMPQGVAPPVQSQIPSMAQTFPVDVIDPEKRRRMMRGMYG